MDYLYILEDLDDNGKGGKYQASVSVRVKEWKTCHGRLKRMGRSLGLKFAD